MMNPDELIEFSESLEAAIGEADPSDVGSDADAVVCFDVGDDEVQSIFDSGFKVAVLLSKAREGGADARVFFGDDHEDKIRYYFVAASEEEAISRVAALSMLDKEDEP